MNKTNLVLNVDRGDLWSFLEYTTCDDKDKIEWKYEHYKKDKVGNKIKKETTYEDIIRGAYYYMVYYEYKYDYEGDIETDNDILYNATKADMFVREYETLTGEKFVELKGEFLDDFYDKVRKARRNYKKSKDNRALFGEEENIKRKMEISPFKKILDKIIGSVYISRTYLMAKNIVENQRIKNQNAQYNIASNILSRTPGGDNNEIILSDLQKIKLNTAKDNEFPDDTDRDGITDGNELTKLKKVDITGFVELLLKAESGLNEVSALLEKIKTKYNKCK